MLLLLPATQTMAVVVYDLQDDFSISNGNPNGVWTYGEYTTNSLTATTTFQAYTSSGSDLAGMQHWDTGATDPNIAYNQTGSTVNAFNATFDPEAVVFGPASGPSVARFTAPVTGEYTLDLYFEGVQTINTAATGALNHNAANLFTSAPLGFGDTANYSTTLNLTAGDTLDAVVGIGHKSTEVRFSASTAAAVPEPSSFALLGLCGLGAIWYRRNRTKDGTC